MKKLKGIFKDYLRSVGKLTDEVPLGEPDGDLLEKRRQQFIVTLRQRFKAVIPLGYFWLLSLLISYGVIFYFMITHQDTFLRLDGPLGAVLMFQVTILRMVQKFLTEKHILDTIITIFEYQTPLEAAKLAEKLFKHKFSGARGNKYVEKEEIRKGTLEVNVERIDGNAKIAKYLAESLQKSKNEPADE